MGECDYIPFGKYKHQRIKDVPSSYLAWLCAQDWVREPLKTAIAEEYDRRCHARANDRSYQSLLPVSVSLAAENIIQTGYRQLSKKLHPDTGGTHESMLELNAAVDWLRQGVEGRQQHG